MRKIQHFFALGLPSCTHLQTFSHKLKKRYIKNATRTKITFSMKHLPTINAERNNTVHVINKRLRSLSE